MYGWAFDAEDQKITGMMPKRVITYVLKAFNATERRYSTIERELAALRFCLKSLRLFLYGVRFVVLTDHRSLVYLQRMKTMEIRLARTSDYLSDFDYFVK